MKKLTAEELRKRAEFIQRKTQEGRAARVMAAKYINPYNVEKLPTGIEALDEFLMGGLPRGQVTLISGKTGDGKSTLVSQIVAQMASNTNHCAYMYSGEMSDGLIKFQLLRQMAGPEHMVDNMVMDDNGNLIQRGYKVDPAVRPDIERAAWDSVISFHQIPYVANRAEYFKGELIDAAQNGIDVFVIDNIMMTDGMLATDPMMRALDVYSRQKEFATWLENFAKDHDVWVILVAHKRKGKDDGRDPEDVAGSSAIVNAVGNVISYGRYTDTEISGNSLITAEDRKIHVTKNRIIDGKLTTNVKDGIIAKFEPKSCRITSVNGGGQYWKWAQKLEDPDFIDTMTDPINLDIHMQWSGAERKVEQMINSQISSQAEAGDIQAMIEAVEKSVEKGNEK